LRRNILNLALFVLAVASALSAQPQPGSAPSIGVHPPFLHRPDHRPPSAVPSGASTAVYDATGMGSPLLLDHGWRVGIGADPAAARPGFDDSGWAVRDAQESFAEVPGPDDTGEGKKAGEARTQPFKRLRGPAEQRVYAWFRLHIRLAPHHGPVALFVELPVSHNTSMNVGPSGPGIDVYANGKLVLPEGPHGDSAAHYQQISRLYNLNIDPAETSLVLVVRTIYLPVGLGSYTGFFSSRKLILGTPRDLASSLEVWSNRGLFERLPRLVNAILLVVLANFLFALYFGQKGHVEYLWLALHELVQAPIAFVELAGSSARLDSLWYLALYVQLFIVSAYLYFEFLVAFLGHPRRWYVRTLSYGSPILLAVGPSLLMIGRGSGVGIALLTVIPLSALWLLGWFTFVFIILISATLKRNFEAGLLLIPLVLSLIGMFEPVLIVGMTDWTGRPYHSPLTIQAGPIPINFASIADFTGIFVIVLIIFFRFLRIQSEQEHASSELAAARSVQELMIPQEKIATPGFEVESVYNPANEVGGDFFHVRPTQDGGLLVVIGDVAGKGLKAAMNVSMLMGALRRSPEQKPARILSELNRVLSGSESFTTCEAAWFGPNGELTIASAGHLPPYLNSQEVALPGGLPLGVLPDAAYDEVPLYMHPGDRLLLLSDGVVEARKASGEIFGFDRVHNLSNQSAFYIADAAKEFGQEDDITVLTVRRLAKAVPA
jgi:hypothetical protein